jgi:hypothetical protein
LNKAYLNLLEERKMKNIMLLVLGLPCIFTTQKKHFFKGIMKIGLVGFIGVSLV